MATQIVDAWLGYYNQPGQLRIWAVGVPVLRDGITHPPPKALTRILEAVLPPHLVGDFEEAYRDRERREGRTRATIWYAGHVVISIWPIASTILRWLMQILR